MKFNNHSVIVLSSKFFTPDKGGEAGGSKTLSIEEQLTSAKTEIATLTSSNATLTKERDDARTETANLKSQFDSATQAARDAQSERDTARNELVIARQQITSISAERDAAKENVSRLETLCGVKGISKDAAVPTEPDAPAVSEGDFETRLKSAKSPAEKAKITAEYEKAVAEGRI